MRIKAAFIFFLTALVYGLTLASSSYVGVYATYAALVILPISGYFMLFGRRKAKPAARPPSVLVESMDAVSGLIGDFSEAMDGLNSDLARRNRSSALKRERTEKERAAERSLRLRRVEWDVHLRHAGNEEEKGRARRELAELDSQLAALRETVRAIEKQCELDAIQEQRALQNRS